MSFSDLAVRLQLNQTTSKELNKHFSKEGMWSGKLTYEKKITKVKKYDILRMLWCKTKRSACDLAQKWTITAFTLRDKAWNSSVEKIWVASYT